MKKLGLACLGVAAVAGSALADPTVPTIPTAVTIDGLGTAVTTWATAAVPTLITIASCFLGFYLLKFGIRALKGIASAGK